MAASFVSKLKRRDRRLAPRVSGLAALALLGMISTGSTRGESVALTRGAPVLSDRGASIGADDLADLSLPALGASPAAAAAIHSATTALIPPSDELLQSGIHLERESPDAAALERDEAEMAKLAVPEPATLVLGLTSTLVLGSLSWKRRLTAHQPSRA